MMMRDDMIYHSVIYDTSLQKVVSLFGRHILYEQVSIQRLNILNTYEIQNNT